MQAPCSVLMGLPIGTGFGAKLPGTDRLDSIQLRKKADRPLHALLRRESVYSRPWTVKADGLALVTRLFPGGGLPCLGLFSFCFPMSSFEKHPPMCLLN